MVMKEWREQADNYLNDVLELLRNYEDVIWIGQENYKNDFFRIFSTAYRTGFCNPAIRIDKERLLHVHCKSQRPLLRGDAIWAHARKQGWVHSEMTANEKRYTDINLVMTWWDEWVYAWNQNPPPRSYRRKTPM